MRKVDVIKLVPKNKFDNSTIPQLMSLSENDITPILPKLLNWIADFNWPIANDVCKVLAKFPESITPLLIEALNPEAEDDELKYYIINHLIPLLPREFQKKLVPSLKRIHYTPTPLEEYADLVYVIKLFFKKIKMDNRDISNTICISNPEVAVKIADEVCRAVFTEIDFELYLKCLIYKYENDKWVVIYTQKKNEYTFFVGQGGPEIHIKRATGEVVYIGITGD